MSTPKNIGERVEFTRSKTGVEVIVHQNVESWKMAILGAWFTAWTFCGATFLYFLAHAQTQGERTMLAISIALWMYFEFKIGRVLMWRWKGKEIIEISNGELRIENRIIRERKSKVFQVRHIHKFVPTKDNNRNFFAFLDDSFWIMGGDRFEFKYLNKQYVMGKYLSDKDVRSLKLVFEKAFRQFRESEPETAE